ncbi:head-to-tail adaptor [Arthrobacter phage BaileyBlu]|uniref:Head-to-tail adaptor n=1 Tax=Arthrobacter phage BaileyBlu TaxID=2910754 RepID=A0AA49BPE6_9CAUD|nr:head-tail adaptor Ad1 [Arthrobacter phage BaileyBlu]UJQ87200.1 head-to-tail adaptor [Arthrobacter phage BaileyBlu]
MAWTTADDVIDAWVGEDAPVDDAKVETWIGKAERLVRFHFPDIQERIDAETEPDLLDDVKDVVVAAVHRVFRNPEGIRQRNETTGPFTGSVTYGGEIPGGLVLTDDELARLSGGTKTADQKAFGVSMIPKTSPFYGGTYGT